MKSERAKMLAGDLYDPLDAELVRDRAAARDLCWDLNATRESDAELRRLNNTFLGHDYATDVLSFPALEGEESLGELAISAPRAKAQAAEFGHAIEAEIEILMLHGALHLLGHDHETDKGAMRRLESRWRQKLSLPAGLIERTRR